MTANEASQELENLFFSFFEWFGELGVFGTRLIRAAMTPPYEGRELLRQMDEVGSKSLALVALAGAAIGVVLSLHTRDSLARFEAKSLLPAVIVMSIIKESGPIITALVVSGRVGAGIGAELGSMKVTEQIDAIEASAVNPYIFGALLLLATAIFIIGDKQFLFSRTYRLNAAFDNVSGLHNGAEVRVGGVRKGTVNHIHLPRQPGEKVTVAMDLESSTREVIKKDSVASIETEGLLGNKYVTVSFGSQGEEPVKDRDTIQSQPPLDLSDLIKKTNQIMDTTSAALKNVDQATADLKSITSKINRGEGTVGALINDRNVYKEIRAATSDVRDTVAEAKVGVTGFQENMQALKQNWFFRGFFKNRGYPDSTQLTKHEIAQMPEGPYLQKFVYDVKDLFEKPKTAKLKKEKLLKPVGEFLERNHFGLAVVAAFTGLTGDKEENLMLTQARAMVIRQYLAEHFRFDDTRVKTKGLGEDEQTEARNASRVEIIVYPEGSEKPPAKNTRLSSN